MRILFHLVFVICVASGWAEDDPEFSGEGIKDFDVKSRSWGSDPCAGVECYNGGTCSDSGNGYTCICAVGYSGQHCRVRSGDPCANNPCQNHGVCNSVGLGGYSCTCYTGYTGKNCEQVVVKDCRADGCPVGQQCYFAFGTWLCKQIVPPTLTPTVGPVDPCAKTPCQNHGVCHPNGYYDYTCTCYTGYSGKNCDQIVKTDCRGNGCPAGQQCQYISGTWSCQIYVPTPTVGPVDPCTSSPCQNHGVCHPNGYYDYTCICYTGYIGKNCARSSDCQTQGCPIGQQCISTWGTWSCQTVVPPTTIPTVGPVPSQPCSTNPCRNGCRCTPSCRHAKGYYCVGSQGYLGKNCDINPPRISCDETQMRISVDDRFVQEYDLGLHNSILLLGENIGSTSPAYSRCPFRQRGSEHEITVPLNVIGGCDVQKSTDYNGQTVVEGTVWLNRNTARSYSMLVPVIRAKCVYTKEYSIITSLQPAVDKPVVIPGRGVQAVPGSIHLCKVDYSCPNTCPTQFAVTGGAIYTVGEMIHLNIRSGGSNSLQQTSEKIAIEQLFVSCDSSLNARPEVTLVSNGCPASTASNYMPTVITHNGLTDCVCVSFQVPRLANCNTVYIHAKITDCSNKPMSTCPSGGSQNCFRPIAVPYTNPGSFGRKRRSVTTNATFDIFGPVYFIEESKGKASSILFPGKDLVKSGNFIPDADEDLSPAVENSSALQYWAVAIISIFSLVIFIITVGCFLSKQHCSVLYR